MDERFKSRFDTDLRETFDRLRTVVGRRIENPSLRWEDSPSGLETRELLGLFAKLPAQDVRRAVLDLMRTIIEGAP